MKKIYILAAIALVAGVSCTKQVPADNNSPDVAISFSPISQKATTKALAGEQNTTYTLGTTPNFEHFSVYSVHTASNYATSTADAGSVAPVVFMSDVDCGYDSTNDAWNPKNGTGGQSYYWPKEGYLSFQAYSPTDVTATHSWATGFTFTNFQPLEPGSQYDLLFSEKVFDKQRANYTPASPTMPYDDVTANAHKGVDINFKHALASVQVQFKLKQAYSNAVIKVKSIDFINVQKQGTFEQGLNDDATVASYQSGYPKWTNTDATTNERTYNSFTSADAAGLTVTTDFQGINTSSSSPITTTTGANFLMLIPQALDHSTSAKHVSVQITYTVQQNSGAVIEQVTTIDLVNGNAGGYYTDGTNSIDKWEIGKRYVYSIIFGLDEIIFDPAVATWEDKIVSPVINI